MMDKTNSDPREVYIIMRKAYIVHSAIAFEVKSGHYYNSGTETEHTVERSFFSIQARVAKTQHLRYLEQFKKWNFYEGIARDPMQSKTPDEKIIYSIPTPVA
jgi:hypothetical protein